MAETIEREISQMFEDDEVLALPERVRSKAKELALALRKAPGLGPECAFSVIADVESGECGLIFERAHPSKELAVTVSLFGVEVYIRGGGQGAFVEGAGAEHADSIAAIFRCFGEERV